MKNLLILLTALLLNIQFFLFPQVLNAQCTGSGSIITSGPTALGNPAQLDPDGDGDIVASGTEFSACTGELAEFEALTNPSGCSTCQIPWTPIDAVDDPSDLWSGSGCGNTDIVGDAIGTSTFAYFTIVDPDGSCNSGDELLVFRLRISQNFSGNFSFDFLISNDGLTGLNDPDGFVCCSKVANAGFEYEVQLKTGGASGVNVIDIDGLAGSDHCGNMPNNCLSYTEAEAAQKSYACGSSCGCRSSGGGNDPVFLTYFVKLSDLGVDCTTYTNLSFVPVTSNSGNPIISSCTSVADVGGAADLATALIDCPDCDGVLYSGCTSAVSEEGCILSCTAENNSFLTALPVELSSIHGLIDGDDNLIKWSTSAEINTDYFSIERSTDGRRNFQVIGEMSAFGSEFEGTQYEFRDNDSAPIWYYRIKIVDMDGSFEYSNTVAIQRSGKQLDLTSITNNHDKSISIRYQRPRNRGNLQLMISDITGRIHWIQDNLPSNEDSTLTINHHSFPKGIYIISLSNGYEIVSRKIVL